MNFFLCLMTLVMQPSIDEISFELPLLLKVMEKIEPQASDKGKKALARLVEEYQTEVKQLKQPPEADDLAWLAKKYRQQITRELDVEDRLILCAFLQMKNGYASLSDSHVLYYLQAHPKQKEEIRKAVDEFTAYLNKQSDTVPYRNMSMAFHQLYAEAIKYYDDVFIKRLQTVLVKVQLNRIEQLMEGKRYQTSLLKNVAAAGSTVHDREQLMAARKHVPNLMLYMAADDFILIDCESFRKALRLTGEQEKKLLEYHRSYLREAARFQDFFVETLHVAKKMPHFGFYERALVYGQRIAGQFKEVLTKEQHQRLVEVRAQLHGARIATAPEYQKKLGDEKDERELRDIVMRVIQNTPRRNGKDQDEDELNYQRQRAIEDAIYQEFFTGHQRQVWKSLQGELIPEPELKELRMSLIRRTSMYLKKDKPVK